MLNDRARQADAASSEQRKMGTGTSEIVDWGGQGGSKGASPGRVYKVLNMGGTSQLFNNFPGGEEPSG